MSVSIEAEQQCALKRANASLSETGHWRTSYAKDVHGRVILDLRGNPTQVTAWIEPQEGKSDDQVFQEICLEVLIDMYNKGKRERKPVFDEHTVNYNGLCRDHLRYRFLKEDLERLSISLYGICDSGDDDLFNEVIEQIKKLRVEYKQYKAMVCPPE